MQIIKNLALIGLGAILFTLIPDRQAQDLEIENRYLRKKLKSFKGTVNPNELSDSGALTILPRKADSITLKGFIGTITWYKSPDFEEIFAGNPANFQRIGETLEIMGGHETIRIPLDADAVFRKNKNGTEYRMEIDLGPTF